MQRVVSDIDDKANKLYIEQEALIMFVTMRQGGTESDDAFQRRLKSNSMTLILAGGKHHLYNPSDVTCTLNNT